jgi:hypothetical protein
MKTPNPDQLLKTLRTSVLFSTDFPKRIRLSHAQSATLDEEVHRQSNHPGLIAVKRVPNWSELVDAVRQLGAAKHLPAVPVLSELWLNCALVPVRTAAGHALRAIGTAEARRALLDQIEDADHFSVFMAVRAIFDESAERAYDRCAPYFEPARVEQPGGSVIPNQILATFAPSSSLCGKDGKMSPQWTESSAPAWLRQDTRWIELCVMLRRHKQLGEISRRVLRHADPETVTPALEKARVREGPRVVLPVTKASGDLVARYRRGEYEAVWNELRSHPALGGDLLEEARDVANETMSRVLHNTKLLAAQLGARGWKPLYGTALHTPPGAADHELITQIEAITGAPIPISLRAFWEIVGGINFVWDYNSGDAPSLGVDLPMDELDPLCVDSTENASHILEHWGHQRAGVDPELADPFKLDLAPDYLHKANTSGGPPYGIELPFLGADPVFVDEHGLPFVDYLRLCFRWGGFPLLEKHADRPDVQQFLSAMRQDFEPF